MTKRKNRQIQEMDSAQKKFEAKAAQFREISTKMRRGMVNAMRNGELERLVGEMTEVLETQAQMGWKNIEGLKQVVWEVFPWFEAESIRSRVRKGADLSFQHACQGLAMPFYDFYVNCWMLKSSSVVFSPKTTGWVRIFK